MRRVISVFLPFWATERWCRQRQADGHAAADSTAATAGGCVTRLHDGRRHVVGAADARARARGILPGQPLAAVQAMHRDLQVIEADPAGDAAALRELAARGQRYAPLTAADPPDGIRIDSTGADHLHGGEAGLLAEIAGRLARAGHACRLAVADTPGAAWGLARYAAGTAPVICPPGGTEAAIAPLPLAALRLPGETLRGLAALGLGEVGALLQAPRAPLARRFGASLLRQLDYVRGTVFEPLEPVPPPSLLRQRLTFLEPIGTAEAFATVIGRLTRAIAEALTRRGEGARRLDLVCERVDGTLQVVAVGTARPVRDAAQLARLLSEKIETIEPGHGVEAMTLWVPLAERAEAEQHAAFAAPSAAGEMAALAPLVDRLVARFGAAQVYRWAPVESDVPERSLRRLPPLVPPTGRTWPAELPRPLRLLTPPQPVQAIAVLPDQPPAAFTWRQGRHRILRADGPERIFGEWWRRSGEEQAVRDYWAVEDEEGARFWLFRRGDGERPETGTLAWFLHGIF
ncbi:Y-family DNA polymerase [Acidisoma sp. 7E03]